MADPFSLTLAAVGAAASAGGAITSAIGSKYSGEAKGRMYEYQAGIAKINEQIEKQNADYARKSGEVVASEVGAKAKQTMGLIKAGQGASGIDVNSGSAVQVRDSQQKKNEFDQTIVRSNAARQAYGFETGALTQQANAGLAGMGAEASRTAGDLGATASIIGGVGSVASKWAMSSASFGKLGDSFIPGNWGEQG